MTQQEYINQNALGFEGDSFLKDQIEALIKKEKISWIIETGTYLGATTRHFANLAKTDTIEINPEYYATAANVMGANVTQHLGSSDLVLEELFKNFRKQGRRPNLFLFLDAHWGDHNPLLKELELIAQYKWKPVIAIHDFKVPGHPELGYDTYPGVTYEWEYIREAVEKIYGKDGFDFWYNSEAVGAKRGVIFIKKK